MEMNVRNAKRLCIVTMIGGHDLIGDLIFSSNVVDTSRLERPAMLQRRPDGSLNLFDMMKNGIFSGNSIELNMISVLWIADPSEAIAKAYRAMRSGLVLQDMAINQ
jgi:hypothetical protein